jgi:hypothetical protein
MKQDPEKRHRWQQHIDALKASGKTRKEYCKANQINSSTLDYWCRKLNPNPKKKRQRKERGWIPLRIREDGSASELDLRVGRVSIAVKPGFDPSLLKELLRAIGALC